MVVGRDSAELIIQDRETDRTAIATTIPKKYATGSDIDYFLLTIRETNATTPNIWMQKELRSGVSVPTLVASEETLY